MIWDGPQRRLHRRAALTINERRGSKWLRSRYAQSRRATDQAWRRANKDRVKAYSQRSWAKVRQEPKRRLENSLSACIHQSIVRGSKARRRTEEILGYTFDELKDHLERQFTGGMSWNNYGRNGWHIDHIIPVASFNYQTPDNSEFKACWSLPNLRPLWAKDNHQKRDKRLHLI